MEAKLDLLLQKSDSFRNDVNAKFDNLDNKFRNVFTTLNEFSEKIDNIDTHLKKNDDKLAQHKVLIDNLIKKDKLHDNELRNKDVKIDELSNHVKQLKIEQNEKSQYDRSSFNVLIGGVPQDSEKEDSSTTESIVKQLAANANITNFLPEHVDVAHRLPSRHNKSSPMIIVRFRYKSARQNFFAQRGKIKSMSVQQLLKKPEDDAEVVFNSYKEAADEDPRERGKVFVTESLTQMNGELLRQAKEIAKQLNYKFFGYTINGEVRVKKSEVSRFIAIKHLDDLQKII